MGYTHYWARKNAEISDALWESFEDDCRKITARHEGILCYEFNSPTEKPSITTDHIRFNGIGPAGHETFLFERHFVPRRPGYIDSEIFGFCKTARKPYDEVVVDILSCAKHRFGDIIGISSDGGDEAFKSFEEVAAKYDLINTNSKTATV